MLSSDYASRNPQLHYDRYKTYAIARGWPIPPYEEWLPIWLKVWGEDVPRETQEKKQ
jgi:hypothetical protein